MALKHNSKQVLDIIAGQKERNATQAYLEVHPASSPESAKVNASLLLSKPEARIYLQEQTKEAAETLIEVMRNARAQTDSPPFQRLAKDTADSIIDRVDGKATQVVHQTTEGISLTIDLTSALGSLSAQNN